MTTSESNNLKEKNIEVEGIIAKISSPGVVVELQPGFTKAFTHRQFISLLMEFTPDKEEKTNLFLIPPKNLFSLRQTETTLVVVCYYPECVRGIMYGTSEARPSVIPNIIISHTLEGNKSDRKNWRVKDVTYHCTNVPENKLDRKLNLMTDPLVTNVPFTNFYDNRTLCFGNNVRPTVIDIEDLRPLIWYYEVLFFAPFNSDLGLRGMVKSDYSSYPAQWYSKLAKLAEQKQPFPYNELRAFNK